MRFMWVAYCRGRNDKVGYKIESKLKDKNIGGKF